MGYWEDESCEYCDGRIVEKHVSLHRNARGKHVLIEHVPAGVCRGCGTRYFAANVLKMIEESVRGHRPVKREVLMKVYGL